MGRLLVDNFDNAWLGREALDLAVKRAGLIDNREPIREAVILGQLFPKGRIVDM